MTNTYERKPPKVDTANIPVFNGVTAAVKQADGSLGDGSRGIEIDTDRVISTAQFEHEKFMHDELIVFLQEPGNENDPQFVEINVNGNYVMGVRGNECKMRRFHVAVLAQAKQTRVRQRKIVNPDGSMGFVEENVMSLSYPFQVMHDPNPNVGGPWLRQLLKNPA